MFTSILATAANGNGAAASEAAEETANGASNLLDSAKDIDWPALAIEYGTPLVGAIILLIVGWIIAAWIGRIVAGSMRRGKVDETLCRFFGKFTRWAIIIFVILSCIGLFGFDITTFAAVLAGAGLAIGLAFQGTLSSFAAGIMLLVFRPFKVGDYVDIGGTAGTVNEVDLFVTLLDTPGNTRIIVPNSSVFGNVIENYSFHPKRRVDVSVGTAYDADIDQAREVLLQCANAMEHKLDEPAPQVMLLEMGDSSINWSVRVWVPSSEFWPTRDALTREIKYGLDNAGIGIPFPQRDVHLFQANG